jgi:hypothetical protein
MTVMNIERPHYKDAPITGENLKLMMKAYYPEYNEGYDKHYGEIAKRIQLLCNQDDLYRLYTMDALESVFIKARPFVLTAAMPVRGKTWVRPSVLDAILTHSMSGYQFSTDNAGLKVFANELGKLMGATAN